MGDEVVLYSYHKSSCSWRIRILLNFKKIAYSYQGVALKGRNGDQHKDDFRVKNPAAQVPVLFIDGIYLSESVAIAEYLEETRREPGLFPKDAQLRARMRTVVEMINAGIQPKQNLAVLTYLSSDYLSDDVDHDEAKRKWAAEWNVRGLDGIEKVLEKWAGKCCIGDTITFADCCLVPQVYSAFRFKIDVEKQFPIIWKVFSYLDKLPEVEAAHASRQPDVN